MLYFQASQIAWGLAFHRRLLFGYTRVKNSYEIASLTFFSAHFAAQTATIHKNTFRLIPAKLYLTARQYTNPLHLG